MGFRKRKMKKTNTFEYTSDMKSTNDTSNDTSISSATTLTPNPDMMYKLVNTPMPFGKYKGWMLIDLPEPYVVWFYANGFPTGPLGDLLHMLYEVKLNGLEYLFKPLRNGRNKS